MKFKLDTTDQSILDMLIENTELPLQILQKSTVFQQERFMFVLKKWRKLVLLQVLHFA